MSPLRKALAGYLDLRRALGFKLDRAEKLLGQFVGYLEQHDAGTVTIEHALAWATSPAGAAASWRALRLSAVRGFAAHLRATNAATEVPPPGLIPQGQHRAVPYLYSDADIQALVRAAAAHRQRPGAATYTALISLLAVSGMRVGEAIALDTNDFDDNRGVLTIRTGKLGKARLLPLDPTSVVGLRQYLDWRNQLRPHPASDALFVSTTRKRLDYTSVHKTFRCLARRAGLAPRSARCRPRIHDLRHFLSA